MKPQESTRILVVDDDPGFLTALRILLKTKFVAEVLTAEDCASARIALSSSRFDLVIIDYRLPDGDGLGLLAEITATEGHPPAIIVTEYGDESIIVRSLQSGASGYVAKDHRLPTILTETVRKVLDLGYSEEALRVSEIRYRRLFETTQDGILVLNADTDKIIDVNQYLVDLLGFSYDEILGKKLWEIGPFENIGVTRTAYHEIKEKGYVRYEYLPLESKDGRRVDVEFVCNGYIAGNSNLIQCNIRDIAARRRREVQQEAVTEELEGYARSVSHDITSPLASVAVAAHLLRDVSKGSDSGGLGSEELLDIIDIGVSKASNLASDLLAEAGAGRIPTETESVGIESVVREVLGEKAVVLGDKGMTVKTSGNLGRVVANPIHMYQLFSNLVGNAVQHGGTSGCEVEVSYLGDDEDGAYRYLVRDNGPGIPPEALGELFEPFFKGEAGGTGIGLSIVEKVVSTYGGQIRAYNDNGACFEFTLMDAIPTET